MSSQFAWVDFAEQDRQRMLTIIDIFKERDTRDELGLGTIRDALADYFFPGTSTIQTRVRYMLFVPWLYLDLERKSVASADIARRARRDEISLIYHLLESEDLEGVIGRQSKNKLQRLPSNIYWAGLSTWGIRQFPGSQDQYHRFLDTFYKRRSRKSEVDQELATTGAENWDPGLPDPPDDFPKTAALALRPVEAQYLQDRIQLCHRESLLALLVTEKTFTAADFVWNHPVTSRVPDRLRDNIRHAQNFSEAVHGAALLYNLFLARKRKHQEWIEYYETWVQEWSEHVSARWEDLLDWYQNRTQFWSSPALRQARIPRPTQAFVEDWFKLLFVGDLNPAHLADQPAVHDLILHREVRLKGKRARLENPRALERWPGQSGVAQLDFRWATAKAFCKDILTGLYKEAPHA